MPDIDLHEIFLFQAIDLANQSVKTGGGPFGAVVVHLGQPLGTGMNRVTVAQDPTAHAEVMAIRDAALNRGSFDLGECVLFASCEPCPMCAGAIFWARVPVCYYAAGRQQAAEAGFDDAAIYSELLGKDARLPNWGKTRFVQIEHADADEPFKRWQKQASRTEY